MARWLTLQETCIELRLTKHEVFRLIESKELAGYRVPQKGSGNGGYQGNRKWRILDPGAKFKDYIAEQQYAERRPIEFKPIISMRELSEIIGCQPTTLRCYMHRGQLARPSRWPPTGTGKRNQDLYFTLDEIRRFFWKREHRDKPRQRVVRSATIMDWVKRVLEAHRQEDVHYVRQEAEAALERILRLPEPERGLQLEVFFRKIEAVTEHSLKP